MKRVLNKNNKKIIILACAVLAYTFLNVVPSEAFQFKRNSWVNSKNAVNLKPSKINKKYKIEEVKLPPVVQDKPKIPFNQMPVMTIEDCVKYALAHSPNLKVSEERVKASETGIGQARANYAPKISAGFNYYHKNNQPTQFARNYDNSLGFNVGVSEMIWDFGRTTAKINMAKYDTLSALYDHDDETLSVIYSVRTAYYQVLSALANLDIYEQNVRIQTLNFERTKAMFEEGLKSKIDVVNAEVNLADAKIQLVDGQNKLLNSIIELQNSMYYQEEKLFVVQNTENFGFLKADYKKKMESANSAKPPLALKRNNDGLILLSSGIEHNDIIQDYKLNPMKLTKQEAVDKALTYRPDLKSEELLVSVQNESLKSIKRQYAPEVTGSLSWSYTKNESSNASHPLQVGAGIGLGSINPYGVYYKIKEGENYLNIAQHNVNCAKADIYWEVQDNYINMRQLERKIPLMSTKVKATLENFELADGRYSVGLNNYVELQDALTNYNKAQLNFVESVLKYNIAREKLIKSMGMGINGNGKNSVQPSNL